MKVKSIIAGLSLVALGIGGAVLPTNMTEAEAKVPVLSVYGEAEIQRQADRAKIFGVIQKASDNKEEVQGVVDVFTEIQQELEEEGVASENVKTLYFYDTFCNFDGEIVYRACLDFCVETENMASIRTIVDELQEEGAKVKSISYELVNDEAYNEALSLATENALSKASSLLNTENMEVSEIEEECFYYCNSSYKDFVDLEGDDLIENITIKARVKVTMDYVESLEDEITTEQEIDKETGEIITDEKQEVVEEENIDKETGEVIL